MSAPVIWHYQDPLQLYNQPNHQSSATEIGEALGGVSQQQATAWNRRIAKQVYKKLDKEPPLNMNDGYRFWNALFDGEAESILNSKSYFIWKLRPTVAAALKRSGIV